MFLGLINDQSRLLRHHCDVNQKNFNGANQVHQNIQEANSELYKSFMSIALNDVTDLHVSKELITNEIHGIQESTILSPTAVARNISSKSMDKAMVQTETNPGSEEAKN